MAKAKATVEPVEFLTPGRAWAASKSESSKDILKSLRYTGETDADRCFSTLMCGEAGTGKTHSSATWPEPILYLNTDHGLRTVSNRKHMAIDFEPGEDTYEDIIEVIYAVRFKTAPFKTERPRTVVLDSLTALCHLLEAQIVRSPPDGKARNEILFQGDYNLIKQRILQVLREVKVMRDIYLVVTAGVAFNEAGGERFENPDCTGQKIGPLVPPEFDAVFRMFHTADGTYEAHARPTRFFPHARIRIPGGDENMEATFEGLGFEDINDLDGMSVGAKGKKGKK